MALTMTTTAPTSCLLRDGPTLDKHCVFGCGDAWFSLPAVSVRQIVMAPELVRVPACHPALAGLGRLRGEFLPVVSLEALLKLEPSNDVAGSGCLLVLEGNCSWSLLISESIALETLETIVSQEALVESANNVVIGTAMFRGRIVRSLNANALLQTAQRTLEQFWNRTEDRTTARSSQTEVSQP